MKRIIMKIIHGICYVCNVVFYFLLFPLSVLVLHKKSIWFISEVNFDARDNGLALFEYIKTNNLSINCVYCISKKNPKYEYVKSLGKTIEPKSFKHLFYFIGCKYKVSTIVNGCVPNYYLQLYFKKHHPYGYNVNLKHGIYKDFSPMDLKQNAHCDLIFCGAKNEYNYILNTYGYTEKEVKYTGLARFDKLFGSASNMRIMIMPTWRTWLDDVTFTDFKESAYFKAWIELLQSQIIIDAVNKGYEVYFYLHPKMNKYEEVLSLFPKNIRISTSKQENGDIGIEALIFTSSMLITDFSSVFFDFAYAKKPAIYYQFDQEDFYKNHYKKSYFDYVKDGYGPVCTNIDDLSKAFNKYIQNGCTIEEEYLKRIEDNFVLRDNKNCERIVKEIIKLK